MASKLYRKVTGKVPPQWIWDMALEVRIPGLFCAYQVYVNTRMYYDSLAAYQTNAKWGMVKGRLLELEKLNYRYISVPRYAVKYEFEVDGVTYTSTRATTGSPYRNWMSSFYKDTITESQYLQAIPILRAGERCTVFYDKAQPGRYSALAHDANSFEISIMCFLAAFPLLMGYYMKAHWWMIKKAYFPGKKMRVRMPANDIPAPPS
jgi:hypothetical protein